MLSRSLIVTVSSFNVSKSTVIAKGIPHSSVLAYLFPTVTPESSTLLVTPFFINVFSTGNVKLCDIILTDLLNFLVHVSIVHKGQQTALEWGNTCREREIGSLSVVLSRLETVLENTIQNSADTE